MTDFPIAARRNNRFVSLAASRPVSNSD
jgi:hypothetical protein